MPLGCRMEGHPTCRHVTLTSKPYSKLNKTAGWRSTIPAGGLENQPIAGPRNGQPSPIFTPRATAGRGDASGRLDFRGEALVFLEKRSDQTDREEIPSVDQHEKQHFEWKREDGWRHHHHAHRHRQRGDDHIDHQKWHDDQEANLERSSQLRDHECRYDHAEIDPLTVKTGMETFSREAFECLQVLLANMRQHEVAKRVSYARICFLLRNFILHQRLNAVLP